MRMWAVVAAKSPLECIMEETPTPKDAEVLVETTHCGVCHSDVHFWEGEYNLGFGKVTTLQELGVKLPRAPGHEVLGRVVAVGPDATGVAIGDRRIVFPWIGCAECAACRSGDDNLCTKMASIGVERHGGFSSHVLVPDSKFLVDPQDLDPALAATYACSGITVLGAIRKLGQIDPDAPVLLVGAGGLGHSAIAMLHALGHRRIIVADIDEAKRQSALEAGATDVLDGNIHDLTGGIVKVVGGPLMYAIDFVNNTRTATATFNSLGKGGRMVLVGVSGGELEISLVGMISVPRYVMGTQTGTLQDLKDLVALASSGKLKPIPIEHMASDKANEALMRLYDRRVIGRLVLNYTTAD
jgi:propanol-preferring alcohol dehydrogenase